MNNRQSRTSKDDALKKQRKNLAVCKYRRTKNAVRKCVEISRQCNLNMVLVIYDKNNNKIKEVHTHQNMTLDTVEAIMKASNPPKYQRFHA